MVIICLLLFKGDDNYKKQKTYRYDNEKPKVDKYSHKNNNRINIFDVCGN